jgi:hypothetical protein
MSGVVVGCRLPTFGFTRGGGTIASSPSSTLHLHAPCPLTLADRHRALPTPDPDDGPGAYMSRTLWTMRGRVEGS